MCRLSADGSKADVGGDLFTRQQRVQAGREQFLAFVGDGGISPLHRSSSMTGMCR